MLNTIMLFAILTGGQPMKPATNWHSDPIGSTHGGVVVLDDGRVLVNTDTAEGTVVLAPDGTKAGTIATQWPAIHGMVVRTEPAGERIYAAHLKGKQALKIRPDGSMVWALGAPMESGKYTNPNQYNPTSIAVAPDGRIYVADGYGRQWVHVFGPDLAWQQSFGGGGSDAGQFRTCHGLLVDERTDPPTLLVCDRENRRIQRFDLNGTFKEIVATDLRRPCAMAISPKDGMLAVAELEGRVTLINPDGTIAGHLGDNPETSHRANHGVGPDHWHDGVHTAPHGLGWDDEGNLYVQDWNAHGRITKWMPSTSKQ
ncbi:MAG: hypothetical protein MK101_03270 [Phycisphaerales bacterium]|nr:hypothetical protein [Phycisphaerales bacterium]